MILHLINFAYYFFALSIIVFIISDLGWSCGYIASLNQTDTYAVSPNEIKMLLPMQCFIKTLKVPRFFSKGIDKVNE